MPSEAAKADSGMAYEAIVWQLEIVGEAANSIDAELRGACSGIEWHKLVGLNASGIARLCRRG